MTQGRRKQSADGQAQHDAGQWEVASISRGKILDLAIFSSQKGTSASNWELPLLAVLV